MVLTSTLPSPSLDSLPVLLMATKERPSAHWHSAIRAFLFLCASHGTDKHSAKSFSGLIACLANGPIAWSSHLQSVVALSSTEAELIALTDAVCQAVYMCKLYNMLNLPLDDPMAAYCNNQSTLKIIAKPPYAYHSRMKHFSIKEGFIYDKIKSGQVNIIYLPTTDNLADFLTKAVPAIKLRGNKIKLNMIIRG